MNVNVLERFYSHVDKLSNEGCWTWTGKLSSKGYGYFTINKENYNKWAHRSAYELLIGPIPDGFEIDHTCHGEAFKHGMCAGGNTCVHRSCVNPGHLEAVPGFINRNRGAGRSKSGYIGVYYRTKNSTWEAWIRCGGKTRYIGMFDTAEEAAMARDDVAIIIWGKEAMLNFS